MKITVQWFAGEKPQFNVSLASKEGAEPFLIIKGCRIVDGTKGRFVSWPAKKQDNGKYWNHVFASDAFGAAVIEAADKESAVIEAAERESTLAKSRRAPVRPSADDDIPF